VACGSTLAAYYAAGTVKEAGRDGDEKHPNEAMNTSDHWLPRVSLAELKEQGYQEDPKSRGAFQAKFAPFALPGAYLIVAGVAIFSFGWAPFSQAAANFLLSIVCFISGLVLCFGAGGYVLQSSAKRWQTGQPMERYLRADTTNGELVFVDHESRTYFTHIFSYDN